MLVGVALAALSRSVGLCLCHLPWLRALSEPTSGTMAAMDNRRLGDRRGDDRREFRKQEGRRDPERDPRNLRRRRLLALVLPLVLLALAAAAHHSWVVQPNRQAELALESTRTSIAPVLARTTLPMMALPGTGGPVVGDPSILALPVAPGDRVSLEQAETELDALWSRVPRSPTVASELARVRLVLGRDRDARRAWESTLVYGDVEQRTTARLGLGLVALRVGLRQDDEQDRLFALEHGLEQLRSLDELSAPEVLFNRGVLLAAVGRLDEAREIASQLSAAGSSTRLSELLASWLEGPHGSGHAARPGEPQVVDSLPEAASLPTIDRQVDPSTETDSIGSPQ